MRRRYQKELYQDRVDLIKQLMPHCAIGVDVIVGFPGETDKHFQETYQFLHQLDVTYLHVFTYSERTDTKALDIQPIIPMAIRNERNKILRNLSYQKLQYFTEQHYQTTRKVLFENFEKNGMMEGYTDNYLRISTPFRNEWANQIIDWKIQ
jgi:threonylcarbamoyladenosine tRNA methylthiotransferase MtaB